MKTQKVSSRLIGINEVKERVGLSRSTIWRRIKEGEFPKNINHGVTKVAWLESEIDSYIENLVQKSRDR